MCQNNQQLWQRVIQEATRALQETARKQTRITYQALSGAISHVANIHHHSEDMNMLLREISLNEVAEGRPMLSAVAINADTMQPGTGFFTAADAAGRTYTDEDAFWIAELNAVYAEWSPQPTE